MKCPGILLGSPEEDTGRAVQFFKIVTVITVQPVSGMM